MTALRKADREVQHAEGSSRRRICWPLTATSGTCFVAAAPGWPCVCDPPGNRLPAPAMRGPGSHFTTGAVSRLNEWQVGGSWRGQILPRGARRRHDRPLDRLRHRVRNRPGTDRCSRRPSASDRRRVWSRRRSTATTTTPLERMQRSLSTCFIGGHRNRTTRATSAPICACASRR